MLFFVCFHDRSLWEELKQCKIPLLVIVGEKDGKFKAIAEEMLNELIDGKSEMVEIPNCGHAVHLENPLPVIRAMRRFFTRLR